MVISLEKARREAVPFELAEVESLMGIGYYCYLCTPEGRHLLVGESGEALRLPALHQAKALLRQLPIRRAELVHRSPYGEMIGQSGDQSDTDMRLPISLVSAVEDTA